MPFTHKTQFFVSDLVLIAMAATIGFLIVSAFTGCAPIQPAGAQSPDSIIVAPMADDAPTQLKRVALAGDVDKLELRIDAADEINRAQDKSLDSLGVVDRNHEQRLDDLSKEVNRISGRVSAIENMPEAPTPEPIGPQLEKVLERIQEQDSEMEALKATVGETGKQIAAVQTSLEAKMTPASAPGCGREDCPCGPECDCEPGSCDCVEPNPPAVSSEATPRVAPPVVQPKRSSVTLLSVPGCPPCEAWKRDVLPELLAKGWEFHEEPLQSGMAPQFRVCIGEACYVHQGPLTGSDLARIVDSHEGRASLQSAPGIGKRLQFDRLPSAIPQNAPHNPAQSQVQRGLFGGMFGQRWRGSN